jgi:hypothetical protein
MKITSPGNYLVLQGNGFGIYLRAQIVFLRCRG